MNAGEVRQTHESLLSDLTGLIELLPAERGEAATRIARGELRWDDARPLEALLAHCFRALPRQGSGPYDRVIMRLGALAEDIRILRSATVTDLAARLSTLGVNDWSQFSAAEYEIRVAAALVSSGFTVEFVPPALQQRERRHDLWATTGPVRIAVECKRKQHITKAENQHLAIWEEVNDAFLKAQTTAESGVDCFLELGEFLRGEDLPGLLSLFRSGARGTFELRVGVGVTIRNVPGRRSKPTNEWMLPSETARPDHAIQLVRAGSDGKLHRSRLAMRCFAYDTEISKKTAGLLDLVRSAESQLPPAVPTLIYLDMNGIEAHASAEQRDEIIPRIEEWLSRHPRISAIILTTERFERSERSHKMWMPAMILKNSTPDVELPPTVAFGSLWGRPTGEEGRTSGKPELRSFFGASAE